MMLILEKKLDFLNKKETLLSNLDILDDYAFNYINNRIPDDSQYKNILVKEDFFTDLDFVEIIKKINLDLLDIIDKLKVISEYEFNSIQGLFYRKNFNNYLDPKPKKIRRNFKKNSDFGQIQLVRNCFFEPSTSSHLDWVDECLKDVEVAFNWNRPAIICSHRLNFVGGMDEMNRNKNLKEFEKLISNIIKKWPDVVFVSSDEIENYL